jgi:hypothetical protein
MSLVLSFVRSSRSRRLFGASTLVSIALFGACKSDSTTSPSIPGSITLQSGDAQSTVVGTGVINPLVVHVTAQNGSALAGAVVHWAVGSTLATLADSVSTTDASGDAKMTFAAGVKSGTLNITATVGSLTEVKFTQKLLPDVPTALTKFGGDGAASIVSGALPLAAKVSDKYGNAVAGQTVTWTIGSAGGALSATSSTTDADGIARTTLTLGATPGQYTVTATYGTFPIITFTVTAI